MKTSSNPSALPLRSRFIGAAVAALSLLAMLAACGRQGGSRESGLEWRAGALEVFARSDAPDAQRLRAEGFPIEGAAPRRLLKTSPAEGLDTVLLLEFPREAAAYRVFQELASHPADFADGFAEREDRVYFLRGRWIGAMRAWAWGGPGWLESGLSLPGAPAGAATLPPEFASLLRQRRFEGSERILAREFLGERLPAPVYAARYDCRGDSAWIYASPGLEREFGLRVARLNAWKVDSSDGDLVVFSASPALLPVRLRFSSRGMAGVEGCFDENLTSFWLKMQERGLKSLK